MRNFLHSRARLLFVGCLLVAGWLAYSSLNSAIHSHQLAQDRAQAERELAQLEEKKAYIAAVKRYVASDAYVEQEARRRLGYIREGEVPFVVISPPETQEAAPTGEWWERLFPR
jgi:cell division protein DivIC